MMVISVRRYFRVCWSIFWRFWVVVCAAGILFQFIDLTPPWDLMAESIWPDYDFNQSVLEIFLRPTLRALLFSAIFIVLAVFRGMSRRIFLEKGSPFEDKQWFAIYIILSLWELFVAALNVLVVFKASASMWSLIWNPALGLIFYLTCLFIATLAFRYMNMAQIAEKAPDVEKPSVNPAPEWRLEDTPSAEGRTRAWNEAASPSLYQIPKPDKISE